MKSIKHHANLAESQRFTAHHAGRTTKLRAAVGERKGQGAAEEVEISGGPCRGRVGVKGLYDLLAFFRLPRAHNVATRMTLLLVI